MKIVIPMAGKGVRFKDAGFSGPKPFIKVANKSMIQWAIESIKRTVDVTNDDFIFILLEEHVKEYGVDKKIKKLLPGSKTLIIKDFTRGAAETVFMAKDLVDPEEELFITDCDQYFILNQFSSARKKALEDNFCGIIPTCESNNLGYSYVLLGENGFVRRTAEKELISTHAAIGVYYFTKSRYFMENVLLLIENDMRSKNEFYVCPVYNSIVKLGSVITIDSDFWMTMGTPREKELFEVYIKKHE